MSAPGMKPSDLRSRVGEVRPPLLIDVRREPAFIASGEMIGGALRRDPERIGEWTKSLPAASSVVVYCVHGHEVSQNAAASLAAAGVQASYLEGGLEEGWKAAGGPLDHKPRNGPTRWVTRERPKIDRIACPWLVQRFVDPAAEFFFVAADQVEAAGQDLGATPYDIPGAEFSHVGELCSFDAFIRKFGIADPALDRLAIIVRGADTGHPELAPQCAGLLAASLGLSAIYDDDHEMLRHGLTLYDALYAWCRDAAAETHGWPPAAVTKPSKAR